jgi:hypothetical protein
VAQLLKVTKIRVGSAEIDPRQMYGIFLLISCSHSTLAYFFMALYLVTAANVTFKVTL